MKDTEYRRLKDMATLASAHLAIAECPGGRPIRKGYICDHCDHDTSHGTCGAPLDEYKDAANK